MAEFFRNVDLEDAMQIEAAARFIFDLRKASSSILEKHGAADISSLYQMVIDGSIQEHPGYDDYLSFKILSLMTDVVREEVRRFQRKDLPEAPISKEAGIHLSLKSKVDQEFLNDGVESSEILKDSLVIKFLSGVILECRILSPQEYSFRWVWGDGEFGIDTCPNQAGGSGGGSHFHREDGVAVEDGITQVGDEPTENLFRLIRAIAQDPFLGTA